MTNRGTPDRGSAIIRAYAPIFTIEIGASLV
jgi:hypothetical protein